MPTLTEKQAEQRIAELEAKVRHLNRLVAVWTAWYDGSYDYVGGHYPGGSQQRILKGESEDERLARYSRELAH